MPPAHAAALLAAMIVAPPPHAASAIVRIDAPTQPSATCERDGDTITVTGRLGIGRDPHPDDPGHRVETYAIITFDPPVCLIEPDAPAGMPVPQADFLTERPPLKPQLGELQTFTGSLERGSEGTRQKFTFVTY